MGLVRGIQNMLYLKYKIKFGNMYIYFNIWSNIQKRRIMTKENRGLASSDEETRERVAREGGKASHGGGRKRLI